MKSWYFADCSTERDDITVTSESSTYNSIKEISGKNGGSLFYLNGTGPAPIQTPCSATAEWSGLDDLECIGKTNHLLNKTKIVRAGLIAVMNIEQMSASRSNSLHPILDVMSLVISDAKTSIDLIAKTLH